MKYMKSVVSRTLSPISKLINNHIGVFVFLAVGYFLISGCKRAETISSDKPNIILFFVDDMGWQDTSVPFWNMRTPFNDRYNTPNMERLAKQGMKFTQAYATPVCSPTRVSLLTGMNATRHRVTNWTLHKDRTHQMETDHPDLIFPEWNVNGLSQDSLTPRAVHATPLPLLLQKRGYHTIHVGKAHFGAIDTPGENPLKLGFDINIAGHAAGAPGSYLATENFGNNQEKGNSPWPVPGLEKYHGKDIFLTEALTTEAILAMADAIGHNKPFFLYMSHYAVHTPIQPDMNYLQKYLVSGLDSIEASYASMVEGMDKSLGDIMDYLEENEIDNNTIILFMSDNGGLSAVARGGKPHTHNAPLSSGKGSIHEGGIREPMIVKWPNVVAPNSVNHDYLIIEDFFPTILELAGQDDYKTIQEIDGISFTGLLKGEASSLNERPLFWHYPNEWGPTGPGIGAFSAVRKGDWKFIYYHKDQRFELFNIKNDIGETINLVDKNNNRLNELARVLGDYLREVDAQMPKNRSTGELIPYPDEIVGV